MSKRLDIMKQFSEGFAAALTPRSRSLSESDHWLSGWDAGYAFRKAKNERLDAYLVSIGMEPQAVITLAHQATERDS